MICKIASRRVAPGFALSVPDKRLPAPRSLQLFDQRRQGYSGCLKDAGATTANLGAQPKAFAVLLDIHHLQSIQICDHVPPFEVTATRLQARLQLVTQKQGQERTKDVAADGRVALVIDGSSLQT